MRGFEEAVEGEFPDGKSVFFFETGEFFVYYFDGAGVFDFGDADSVEAFVGDDGREVVFPVFGVYAVDADGDVAAAEFALLTSILAVSFSTIATASSRSRTTPSEPKR